MSDNDQGIWNSLTCIREAALVAQKHKANWDRTALLPLPSYIKSQVKPSGRQLYVEAMSRVELGL